MFPFKNCFLRKKWVQQFWTIMHFLMMEHKSRPLTKDEAKLEKKADELEGFQGSDGWLDNFKRRHSITFKENQGEAAEIDLEALRNWQQDVLRKTIFHFSEDDVFNADKTGLFWQLLPNKTLAFKGWCVLRIYCWIFLF